MYDEVFGFLKSTADTTALVTQRSETCTSSGMKWGEGLLRGEGGKNSSFSTLAPWDRRSVPENSRGLQPRKGESLAPRGNFWVRALALKTVKSSLWVCREVWAWVGLANPSFDRWLVELLQGNGVQIP